MFSNRLLRGRGRRELGRLVGVTRLGATAVGW